MPSGELASRETNGLSVTLWLQEEGLLEVCVIDTLGDVGETFTLQTRDGREALDMFHHPYAYRGMAVEGFSAAIVNT